MKVAREGETVRENVLREQARRDPEGALVRYGYRLTDEEKRGRRGTSGVRAPG